MITGSMRKFLFQINYKLQVWWEHSFSQWQTTKWENCIQRLRDTFVFVGFHHLYFGGCSFFASSFFGSSFFGSSLLGSSFFVSSFFGSSVLESVRSSLATSVSPITGFGGLTCVIGTGKWGSSNHKLQVHSQTYWKQLVSFWQRVWTLRGSGVEAQIVPLDSTTDQPFFLLEEKCTSTKTTIIPICEKAFWTKHRGTDCLV